MVERLVANEKVEGSTRFARAEYYEKKKKKNFDNPGKIMKYLDQKNRIVEKQTLLFNHPEFLKS